MVGPKHIHPACVWLACEPWKSCCELNVVWLYQRRGTIGLVKIILNVPPKD
jgi:hypothetical protein